MIHRPAQHFGVTTPEHYHVFQEACINQNKEVKRQRPALKIGPWPEGFRDPWDFPEEKNPPVYIGNGTWFVRCRGGSTGMCGDAVSVDPIWRIGRCCWCGAVYSNVQFPADWQAIEEVLLRRPLQKTQNWQSSETVADLIQENIDHGVDPKPQDGEVQ